ncbi:hypothetical protein LFL96_16400 [Paraburkholderia sp. D15]|uniref:hypothetical protein n=1 Tax=Paraburkholderia sp. D15 TaxID=2880218 RepID=UPI002479F975|nr:hypothetical protein [Paraburkholderia sp. D15]WGS49324.1 hypothetical protein LFL96_16400 [Paraburkholderia sp. D15]WKF57240.1 hypothetical protein HUO10_001719 [Paraburkholderia busanensis]
MRGLLMIGAAAMLAGCVSSPSLNGTMGAPSFVSLQQMCSAQTVDYGSDAQGVYAALFDAYVANRHGKLSKDDFCGFQAAFAQRYTSQGTSTDPQVRNQWVAFFTDQRAKAISWRAAVDPTLRNG